MFKFFDPNQTVKHIPYKVLKAQFKREQERSDKFFRILIRCSLAGVLILAFLLYVSQYM